MTVVPETPLPSSEKLVDAIRDHTKETERELAAARTEIANLNRQIDAAMNEAGILREQLAAKTKAFDAVQAYATGLDTKLQVIVDVIGGVKADAMKFGARKFGGIPTEDSAYTEVDTSGGIRSILDRLAPPTIGPN